MLTKTRSDLLLVVARLNDNSLGNKLTETEKDELIRVMRQKIEKAYELVFALENIGEKKDDKYSAKIGELLRTALES